MIDITNLNLNATCLLTFGEPVTFVFSGGNVVLTAIFGMDSARKDISSAQFNDAHYALEILQTDITDNNIALRGTVIVRGVNYQIMEIADDTGGMAKLYLRRYA